MNSKFLILNLILVSNISLACPVDFLSLSDFEENGSSQAVFPGYLFSQFEVLKSFEQESCVDAIREREITGADGKPYTAIYTFDDGCDGGNSYGLVLEKDSLRPIATIQDGDMFCL